MRAADPAVSIVVAGTVFAAAAYAVAFLPGSAPAWSGGLMVGGIALLCTGMMALGVRRSRARLGPALWAIGFVFLVLVACLGGALLLPGDEQAGSPLVAGLPIRAALVVIGVGLIPALVLPVVYLLGFDADTLSAEDLDRLRTGRGDDRGG